MKLLLVSKPLKMEQLGLMYLSAAAKKAGHIVSYVQDGQDLEGVVKAFKPDFIGYSVMTGDQNNYFDINNRLKKQFKFRSIFGGPHPTFFPEMIMQDGVDVICRGEGEEPIVDLLNNPDNIHIDNLWFNNDGKIRGNDVRYLSHLGEYPNPDRALFKDVKHISSGPIRHFIGTRGCPFGCSYCFNEKYAGLYDGKGPRVRFRDPNSLVQEVLEATTPANPLNKGVRFVYFQDDTFTLNVDWLREFSKLYKRTVRLPFHCHVRANTCDSERVELLKQAGCFSVHLAAETANDRLRNEILNRNMSVEQIVGSCVLLRSHGIKIMLQNMIGLPTGTIRDDLDTLAMNIKCQPEYAWVSIFQPYPGTTLGERCKKEGWYNGDFSDIGENFYDRSLLNFSDEYKNQLRNLQRIFAFVVEHPKLYPRGIRLMIDNKSLTRFDDVYRDTREKADERLYGFSLSSPNKHHVADAIYEEWKENG